MDTFMAFQLAEYDGAVAGRVERLSPALLGPGEVTVRIAYAGVNYKDALAIEGRNRIIRDYPRIPGIDFSGQVLESDDPRYAPGDAVVGHGYGIGTTQDGGYAQLGRFPGDWLHKLPPGITLREAATLGAAGFTAAYAIDQMELNGLAPAAGKVAVTGATVGVAGVAIELLAQAGYHVVAITGKAQAGDYLRELGAAEVLLRGDIERGQRPLEKALWAGAVDSVGGEDLAWLTRTMQPGGVIGAFGNAGGADLHTTVLPFILRGVRLLGININTPPQVRERVWQRLSEPGRPRHLMRMGRLIGLADLPQAARSLLEGRNVGRLVVDLNA